MTIRELRQAYLDGATIGELAIRADLPQREVRYALGLISSYDDRTKKYAELYEKGLNDCQIAAELDVERSTICNWRKRTGRRANWGSRV